MTINKYTQAWCDETYRVEDEEFFVDNAYYTINREWDKCGKINRFVSILAFLFPFIMQQLSDNKLLFGLTLAAITSICFFVYAIRKYDANDANTKTTMIAVVVFALMSLYRMSLVVNYVVILVGVVIYFYMSWFRPIRFKKIKKKVEAKFNEAEDKDDAFDKETYAKWEDEQRRYRYNLPSKSDDEDTKLREQARAMFDGYITDKQTLKTRYRQLVKQHHPDVGGDTELFKRIVAVYEELDDLLI